MKNYKFSINGNQYEVEVFEVEGNIARIEVNGTTYNVELQQEAPLVKPKPVAAAPKVTKEPVAGATIVRGTGPMTQVKAPLPGVIIQVLVRQGDSVAAGQTLCTLETMKMENAIKADNAGVVASVKIAQGQSVLQDEVLIEIN